MTLITLNNVNNFFTQQLELLQCQEKTRAYIVSILSKYKNSFFDYSGSSLTLQFYEARTTGNFAVFQNLADWIFFCESVFPEHLQDASKEYYHSLAQVSYYTCYKMINRKIDIYENLADEFTILTKRTNKLIQRI
jgi:hypothetical protein